ncbi:MAG: hypothetical protein NUV63_04095 [Gallionella sp.]|uniref:hypothetical protein n=1 Tax=Sulfuricaulis sp. TaxID=2003553 RepID=UPI0025F92B8F|nr:hypothetical protein [Sulfuricaulis sp.]MCR4303397.1 hypothetical protein [Gallionella sp.]MCR4346835.1 hypothetical protein [Sulfuricaulis sp.]
MKREVPAEREIADLIASAFDRLPAPDARRLAAIEQRLLEQPRLRGRTKFAWWWLAAALVAGAASALWWAVDYDSGKGREAPVPAVTSPSVAPSTADQPTRPNRSEGAESKLEGELAQKKGPVIYRKEQ